jgi:hypothetical protein
VPILTSHQRNALENACTKGRRASEQAVEAILISLGVAAERPPAHLNEDDRQLRRGLRAKARQLGDTDGGLELLVVECAYEQWHRLLFARFLAENDLLIHPEYQVSVTLDDCAELADSLREPDGWSVAASFAAEILPGIFRLDDPCVRLRLAPEGRLLLESIVADLPPEIFASDDGLGWVYQFWQKDKKEEVNDSERKVGGSDLGPVTQLFTENYMVRFLLDNTLGAWWTSRHPDSPLIKSFEYLRSGDDGKPAAGAFESWPDRVADVTVMDPCCGSGHFLVEAFSMLWQMRQEEEELTQVDAQDAVLHDNLFGLELDPRCVQIAMFAVALTAWKSGGGWRSLPTPNVACSGIPVRASVDDWKALALGNEQLENALMRLHILFRHADTLGSLNDGAGAQRSFDDSNWEDIAPLLSTAVEAEKSDPASSVLGADARSIARAADCLSRHYTLTITNVPYLSRAKQSDVLRSYLELHTPAGMDDLATSFLLRCLEKGRTSALVTPQNWQQQKTYTRLRNVILQDNHYQLFARLGNNCWQSRVSNPLYKFHTVLSIISSSPAPEGMSIVACDIGNGPVDGKSDALRSVRLTSLSIAAQRANPEARIIISDSQIKTLLSKYCRAVTGIQTGDTFRYVKKFWELQNCGRWIPLQSTALTTEFYTGRTDSLDWQDGQGALASEPGAYLRNTAIWGNRGIAVKQMGDLHVTLYTGEAFDNNVAVLVPNNIEDLPALWAFASSDEYAARVREINARPGVTTADLAKVPIDLDRWRTVAEQADPIPEPSSNDPTQWLFTGRPEISTAPLQVAVARLLAYRWPGQPASDYLDAFADSDGIVCLPSVAGEPSAADRLQQLLAVAFGPSWSPAKQAELLGLTGGKKRHIGDWLRDEFFKQHCALFGNRPFIWHLWDGQREGFSALVNYHRLDRKTLEKLTYTYLGDWIERQRGEVRDDAAGSEDRLTAAMKLRKALELVLEGEPPFDIYTRWKPLADQAIGWQPDVNDGVRVNVRPFVGAGILRSSFNIHWRKDRGRNPDGSERLNDLHFTTSEKRNARDGKQ